MKPSKNDKAVQKYKNVPMKKYSPKELEEIEYEMMHSRNGMFYVNEYKIWNNYHQKLIKLESLSKRSEKMITNYIEHR